MVRLTIGCREIVRERPMYDRSERERSKMPSNKEMLEQIDTQEEMIDQAREVLENAYTPEATRADLVAAVSDAIDILSGEAEAAEDNEDDEGE
jgi:hypothetical protein